MKHRRDTYLFYFIGAIFLNKWLFSKDYYPLIEGIMEFNRNEKLAVVKAISETIHLDDQYRVGELVYLDQLMKSLDFDAKFVQEAKSMDSGDAVDALKGMSEKKKDALLIMINEMTEADGEVDDKELDFFVNLLQLLRS